MAAGAVLLVAAVIVSRGVHSSIPPKFIRAAYGVQKALYAKDFGYSLRPIPTFIQRQAHPPETLPLVGELPKAVVTARRGRAYKYYRSVHRPPPRRRKRPAVKRRRPSSYGVPIYATKYKNYIPSRRPTKPYRYSKRRPHRPPPRRPYREQHPEFDDYEQEIPDDYDEYDQGERGDYSYFDIPSKRLPLQYDKEFVNRHADLYNTGYNPGLPRGRLKDGPAQFSRIVRTRVRYHPSPEDTQEQADKTEESQETMWSGEVSNAYPDEVSWRDHSQTQHWREERRSPLVSWHDRGGKHPSEWHRPRPSRQDNQWQVYEPHQHQPLAQPQLADVQQHHIQPQPQPQQTQVQPQFQWPPRTTQAPEVRGWTTSLRPKPLGAALVGPSRPVTPREQEPSNHKVYNWDPVSQTYQEVSQHDNRPRYQAHYSETEFNYHSDSMDRRSASESSRSHRAFSEPDIGYGDGMEVVDDGVAGWKVDK